MLRISQSTPPLSAAEQFALDTLVDQSRLLRVDGDGPATDLRILGEGRAPTVAGARGKSWCVAAREGHVELERPVLALVAELAGAILEQRSSAEDQFGRVPPMENALVRAGEEREPVVGHIAVALRRAVIEAAGRARCALVAPWPDGKRWAMAMTHDLDIVAAWPAYSAMRFVELLGRAPQRAVDVAFSALGAITGENPVRRAALDIMRQERVRNVRSTWFVLAGTPTFETMRAGDITYEPEHPLVRELLAALRSAGHEVGLHGSFASWVSRDVFREQRERLLRVSATPLAGVRQHFLRMRPGVSHVEMSEAGFAYDSTFGFSERNGFRLGVADVVPVWDDRAQRVLPLDEVPFTWMDRALSKYRNIEDPAVWVDDALAIAKAVRGVDGVWNGIWHPNMDDALGFPRAPESFRMMLDELGKHHPWSAPLGEVVAWRRLRRSTRAVASPASGPVPLKLAVNVASAPIALEDREHKAIPHTNA